MLSGENDRCGRVEYVYAGYTPPNGIWKNLVLSKLFR